MTESTYFFLRVQYFSVDAEKFQIVFLFSRLKEFLNYFWNMFWEEFFKNLVAFRNPEMTLAKS